MQSDEIEPSLIRATEEDNHQPAEAAFKLSRVPSRDWHRVFTWLWQNQRGPRSIASWRPNVRIVDDMLFMDVEGHLDTPWAGPSGERVGTVTHFQPWVEMYIGFANERLAVIRAEQAKQEEAAKAAKQNTLDKLKSL